MEQNPSKEQIVCFSLSASRAKNERKRQSNQMHRRQKQSLRSGLRFFNTTHDGRVEALGWRKSITLTRMDGIELKVDSITWPRSSFSWSQVRTWRSRSLTQFELTDRISAASTSRFLMVSNRSSRFFSSASASASSAVIKDCWVSTCSRWDDKIFSHFRCYSTKLTYPTEIK